MSISANYPALRPALLLDFANSQQLDPRVTFSRSTTAPYYDGKTSALAEQNLLTYSQTFSNAAWIAGLGNASFSSTTTTAPDGTATAGTLLSSLSTGTHSTAWTFTSYVAGTYTLSWYIQANTNSFASIYFASGSATNAICTANLSTGAITKTGSNGNLTYVSSSITLITGTYYRVSLTVALATTTSLVVGIQNNSSANPTYINGGPESWAALGTESINIWGAQLEQRSSVTAYNATTTTPITNYIPQLLTAPINAPRFDFNPTTGESLGLLIEEQRTNLLLQSENVTSSPWGAGVSGTSTRVQSGWNAGFNIAQITATSANGGLRQTISGLTSGQVYTLSFYLQSTLTSVIVRGENSLSTYGASLIADINPTTGAIGTNAGFVITSAPLGNGRVYKCVLPAAGGSLFLNIEWISATTNIPFYLGAFQLEAGAFPTSYISTTSAQVTRAADNPLLTGTNFSSWYNNTQGTVLINYDFLAPTIIANQGVFSLNNGTGNTRLDLRSNAANNTNNGTSLNSASMSGQNPNGVLNKIALSYIVTASNGVVNGGTVSSYSLAAMPQVTQLQLGNLDGTITNSLNGHIRKFSYYPIAFTGSQNQSLTGS